MAGRRGTKWQNRDRVAQKRHNEKNGINKEGMNKEGMVENGVGAGWLEMRVHEKKQ